MEIIVAVLGSLYIGLYVLVFGLCRAAAKPAPEREETPDTRLWSQRGGGR